MASTTDWGPLDRLAELAQTLAGAWGGRARSSTTVGQERAILRLFGVHGLDAAGRPLAGEVADRYVGHDRSRLASGIALPFAMALLEYDVGPQQLALDVASGAIDLAFEGELLRQLDRRQVAEEEAARLSAAALAHVDANRTARRELVGLLGDAPRPWIGTTLLESVIDAAVTEATNRIEDGIDLLRVEVPVGRELATSLADAGLEAADWQWGERPPYDRRQDPDTTPAGSQRGLAELRVLLDEEAANRRRYVRLATAAPPLAAPEQAVVAAFERIDLVEADPMAEIVAGSVDPDRALADHAFAHRLLRRAGTSVLVGAGPLVVAPDLASGIPSDAATRAGRALALQLLGVALARGDGLPPDRIVVGVLPPWLTDEPAPAARAAAEVALRRALLGDHPLAFEEPVGAAEAAATWPFILAGVVPAGGATTLVTRTPTAGSMRTVVAGSRAAVTVGAELAGNLAARGLEGVALEHARGVVTAAIRTLERLADVGWRSVLGEAPGGGERVRIGADAVAERSEGFDAISRDLAPA
jgi:D-Lysine 5,6-aminomutase TIM-barrel domain of alpha subunit